MEFVELDHPEDYRTYTFPGEEQVTLHNVIRVAVSESGTHRLETEEDGFIERHIIPVGWIHIAIATEEWTF